MIKQVAFLDIETKYLFDEVEKGRVDLLGLAVAGLAVNDSSITFYEEENVEDLFKALHGADLIVGHNLLSFDYRVLNPYASFDLPQLYCHKTLDTLREIENLTGRRVSLDDLARHNLGRSKSADPRRMPIWWREGRFDEVKSYCANDVEIVRDIYLHGRRHGRLTYTHKEGGILVGLKDVEVGW